MDYKMKPISTTPDSAEQNSIRSNGSWNGPGFQLELVKMEKARRNLKEFVNEAWPVLEPSTEFVDSMHLDAICWHLQAVTEGRIAHLIVNVPPGHAKSLLVCVFWPAWVWIDHPEQRRTSGGKARNTAFPNAAMFAQTTIVAYGCVMPNWSRPPVQERSE